MTVSVQWANMLSHSKANFHFTAALLYEIQGRIVVLLAKIVHDLLVTGEPSHVNSYLAEFNKKSQLRTKAHGPDQLWFFNLQIIQHHDMTCLTNGNENLQALEPVSTFTLSACAGRKGTKCSWKICVCVIKFVDWMDWYYGINFLRILCWSLAATSTKRESWRIQVKSMLLASWTNLG